MLAKRNTKIVATIGPASQSRDQLKKCMGAGMNVARLNFSHSDHATHSDVIKNLTHLMEELKAPVSILQDLQGPKIRVEKMKDLTLKNGEEVIIADDFIPGTKSLSIDLKGLSKYAVVDQSVLIDDGLIELKISKVLKNKIICEVVHGGVVKERKGVNLPNMPFPMKSLTDKDLKDLKFGLTQPLDYVALSFVRRAQDILDLRKLLKTSSQPPRIVAKIEMADAIEHLEEIVAVSDAVMVARGDLAVEVGQARLASLQKKIITVCNQMGKPVITATQMLESMRDNPRPTRAEVTDVVNAVFDGSDALMLSAESAQGKFPVEAIRTMHELIVEAEKQDSIYNKINLNEKMEYVPEALAVSAALCASKLDAKAIVCMSTSGRTARLISRFRPQTYLLAVTDKVDTLRGLELCWGVQTLQINKFDSTEEVMTEIENVLVSHGIVKEGDRIVCTLGTPVRKGVKTNTLRVITVGNHGKVKKVTRALRYQMFPF